MAYHIPATALIMQRLWNTFLLSFFALIFAWGTAIPLGIWAAVRKDSWVDRGCSFIAFFGLSIPDVLLSLLALWFAASTGWFPVGGAQSPLHDLMSPLQQFWDYAHHLILPALVLARRRPRRHHAPDALVPARHAARRIRPPPPARAALGEGWVIYKHALRNANQPAPHHLWLLAGRLVERRVHRRKHHGLARSRPPDHRGVLRQGFLPCRGRRRPWPPRCWSWEISSPTSCSPGAIRASASNKMETTAPSSITETKLAPFAVAIVLATAQAPAKSR